MKKRAAYILLIALIFLFGCAQQSEKTLIKDIVIGELAGDTHAVSFFVVNKNQEIGDCHAKLVLNDSIYRTYSVGLIQPDGEQFFETTIDFKHGETSLDIQSECEWVTQKEADICNKDKWSERKLCRLALDKPNLQQCLTGDVSYYKFFCIALISKDPAICDYIGYPLRMTSKMNWCKAYITGDISFCENAQDTTEQDWCYTDIGMNLGDPSICDKIIDKKGKTSCMAVATKNPDLCLEGIEEYKTSCIINLVEKMGDKSICNLLSGEQKEECSEQTK